MSHALSDAASSVLDTPISAVPGLRTSQRAALQSLGLNTVRDLIFNFPFRHEDFTKLTRISEIAEGESVTVVATVVAVTSRRSFKRRGLTMTEAVLEDESGRIKAIWFNQPYLAKSLQKGSAYRFAGKTNRSRYGLSLANPLYEVADSVSSAHAAPLLPVYGLTQGVSQLVFRRLLDRLRPAMRQVEDPLPPEAREQYRLIGLSDALVGIHFPESLESLRQARRRLGFDEMFRLQLLVSRARAERGGRAAPAVRFDEAATKSFVHSLPFELTDDQRRSAWEILLDMAKPHPMHRLLDGDVGSGKTVVAAIAALNAARAGFQTALMAPTEILAKQHFEGLTRLLAGQDVRLALWTNAYRRAASGGQEIDHAGKAASQELLTQIAAGEVGLVIGTHALIEDSLKFSRLALAVVDEQHRFGVGARQALCRKSGIVGEEPHLLSMTATPIPRSLALTFYGDLELSLLKQKPKNRRPIVTRLAGDRERAAAYVAMRQEIAAGRQVFVVCPTIDASDALGVASVTEEAKRLAAGPFAGIPLGILHGKLKPAEKESVMREFLENRLKVLVSTSVIEVGVDVPNATVMAIEGAERFGLAQLHQFRGRVGRGEHQSYCWLLPSHFAPTVVERLRTLVTAADGFALAEKDLALRGPGDLLGENQSGFPLLRVASFADVDLIMETRAAARRILEGDPELNSPLWRHYLPESAREAHLE